MVFCPANSPMLVLKPLPIKHFSPCELTLAEFDTHKNRFTVGFDHTFLTLHIPLNLDNFNTTLIDSALADFSRYPCKDIRSPPPVWSPGGPHRLSSSKVSPNKLSHKENDSILNNNCMPLLQANKIQGLKSIKYGIYSLTAAKQHCTTFCSLSQLVTA